MHFKPSPDKVDKLTVIPLADLSVLSPINLPTKGFDLGFGITVQDFSDRITELDLGVWERAFSEDQLEEIQNWSTWLVHGYSASPAMGAAESASSNLLGYVIAHLRLLNPNRTSRADQLHLQVTSSGKLDPFSCSKAAVWPQIHLTDCEAAILGVKLEHLEQLKSWMPWIVEFATNWNKYHPLWVSLYFREKFYGEFESFRARHLFLVLAIEALLCSEQDRDYGRQALRPKIQKMLGWHTDLYESYNNPELAFQLPWLPLTDKIIDDVYTLRNKVAHGDQLPPDWTVKNFRPAMMGGSLAYVDVLCEAAVSILRSVWLKLISEGLQNTFGDKKAMQKFFRE